ncbi:MAG: NAD(P)/FAD-dependent oxidoreductase [Bacteroidales bacterium]|nr:NAD(P)/FAD-dependent oxidoreductase [Bacteroidales bacterium]
MKVSIIGAGVSGLAAGCYLQMSDFHTTIFEQNDRPGGLCVSWKRGEYTFESGFQWLLGSGPANPFYLLWSELIDMKSIHFITHESRMDIEVKETRSPSGETIFHLYTNLDRLRSYLVETSPDDRIEIDKLIQSMRRIQSFEIPPMIKKVPQLLPLTQKVRYMKYLPLLWFLNRIRKETNYSFARKLKSPFLREAFELLFDGEEVPLMVITLPLAYGDLRAAGYPVGGAAHFIEKLKDTYLKLGGEIHFKSPVRKILVRNNRAEGIQLENGSSVDSDLVLSAADWHYTVFEALDGKYINNEIRSLGNLENLNVYHSLVIVSLGIKRSFEGESHFLRMPLEQDLVSPDGTTYSRLEANIYNYDPTLAPAGKTVVSVSFYTREADWWIDLRKRNRALYSREKTIFAREVIDILEKRFGRITEHVEEVDVATPASIYRYTNNWKGSAQGWLPGKNIISRSPIKPTLPGLKNFYYTGHWSIPGGGLPVALKSARDAAQIICHDTGLKFGIEQ